MKNKRTLSLLLVVSLMASLCVGIVSFAATKFTDVPNSYWAHDEIEFIVNKGLFNGTTATTFSPDAQMKRGQLAAVLYRYAGEPKVNGASGYSDVSDTAYYANACAWAKENKIFMADKLNATTLNPDEGITRSEFAVMLYNFAKLNDKADVKSNASNPYTDMKDVSNEIKTAIINWAVPAGILGGTTDTTMNPFGAIKRSHVAAMLYRYETKIANPGSGEEEKPSETKPTTPSDSTKTSYSAGDTLVLKKGGNYNVSVGVGEKVYINDQLSSEGIWTAYDGNKFVNDHRVAELSWDSAKNCFAIVGVTPSDVTIQCLSSKDYTTVLATFNVTVTSGSSSSGGNGNSDNGNSSGLTEQDVYDAIIALKSKYPQGMNWTNDNVYDTPTMTYRGCAAFGAICAEAAFGSPAGKRVDGYDGARVGDRIRFDGHTVVVLEDAGNHYVVADGNNAGTIQWEWNLPKDYIASYSGVYIETNW